MTGYDDGPPAVGRDVLGSCAEAGFEHAGGAAVDNAGAKYD